MNSTLITPIVLLILICISLTATAQHKHISQYPNQFTRDGHLIVLPDHGTIYIVSDLHAHWDDFNQWLQQTQLIERIEDGEDVYGLMLGDSIDYKPGEVPQPPYGDIQIINRVIEIQQQLGENGNRFIYLRGNHEYAAADIYEMLKKRGMNEHNRKEFIEALYNSPLGPTYQQFNFIERMSDVHLDFLMNIPTIVVAKNGFTAVHAGPARSKITLNELIKPGPKLLDEILWDRPDVAFGGGYTHKHTKDFLELLNAKFLVVGHTPISYFPKQNIRDGVARLGGIQLIFSTGYGGLNRDGQTYIEIDLAKTYTSVDELKLGINIHRLYPE